nr:hypothetical protein [Rhodococcus sp. (in: high G+C Gram-positive bacteria)]
MSGAEDTTAAGVQSIGFGGELFARLHFDTLRHGRSGLVERRRSN